MSPTTTAQLCDLLHLHEETIRKYARTGELESVRIGSDRRYPESAVRAFLDVRADASGTRNSARGRRAA